MACLLLPISAAVLATIFFYIKYRLSWPTRWCRSQRCLVGKTAVITGANTGLGYETALDFAKRGAKVILGCRDEKRAAEARQQVIEETDNPNIVVRLVDFSSFDSVRAFAKEINQTEDRLDILVNNAGISFADDTKTKDECDLVMQVNYYSHFLLTNLLLKLMVKSGQPGRIVNISSLAACHAYSLDINNITNFTGNWNNYSNSKLCNIFFTKELARRLKSTKITTYSLHPGAIKTDIFRRAIGIARILTQIVVALFYKPLEEGAQTIIYCSVEKNIERFSGDHFDNCKRVKDYPTVAAPGAALKLWEITENIVKLGEDEKFHLD